MLSRKLASVLRRGPGFGEWCGDKTMCLF
jgi:hypothetical protein